MKLQNLTVGYHGTDVLKNITLSVPEGCILGIIGPNGSGKTTLLKAIAGLLPLAAGEVWCDGVRFDTLAPIDRAKLVSYLPQQQNVPDILVELFVSYGRFPYLSFPRQLTKKDTAAVRTAMETAGIVDLSNRLLTTLSGGQRQMVYLARLLAQDTPYLLLDEPTTYLDIRHRLRLMRHMKSLGDKTTIVVLHDIDLALSSCDEVAVLADGGLLGQGTPVDAVEKGWITNAFGVHVKPGGGYCFEMT